MLRGASRHITAAGMASVCDPADGRGRGELIAGISAFSGPQVLDFVHRDNRPLCPGDFQCMN